MDRDAFLSDIPRDLAQRAHAGTSFVPEQRADQEREEYARTLEADHAALLALADTDEKRARLAEEFARYRDGFRRHYVGMLAAKSRCVSTMIAGGSKFPVRRQEKYGRWADNKTRAMIEFRQRALKAIRRELCPEVRPVMSGDSDAVERLRAEIAAAEAQQDHMVAVNKAIRKHLGDASEQLAALLALGVEDRLARKYLQPDCMGSIGFPHFKLTNNGANIRRMKARLVGLERVKAAPAVAVERADGIRLEDDPPGNRVRLYFPGKPGADVRGKLKSRGFRWAPSLGCWQAYRNSGSLTTAREVAGVVEEAREAAPAGPLAVGARVERVGGPALLGTVTALHEAGESCETCIGSPAHAVVKWDDGPHRLNGATVEEFDEDPGDLRVVEVRP